MANNMTPAEFAEKWSRRLKGSIDDIRRGIDRVTEAPGAKAAAKADKWHSRVSSSETKAKWARRVGAVPLDAWKEAISTKGLARIAAGADAAVPKVARFAEQLMSHQSNLQVSLERMPDLTLEDSINRMSTWVRGMAEFELRD